MTVQPLRYFDGHGHTAYGHGDIVEGKMTVGVFAAEHDTGNVAAGQSTVLRDVPMGDPDGSEGHTVAGGWA